MDKIIKGKLALPPYLTPDARDLIKKVGALLPFDEPLSLLPGPARVPGCLWAVGSQSHCCLCGVHLGWRNTGFGDPDVEPGLSVDTELLLSPPQVLSLSASPLRGGVRAQSGGRPVCLCEGFMEKWSLDQALGVWGCQ